MKLTTPLRCAALMALSTSAAAVERAPEPTISWTGLYFGLGGGGAAPHANTASSATTLLPPGGGAIAIDDAGKADGAGAFGTIEVGGDRQFDRIVAGVFANFDFGDATAKRTWSEDYGYGPQTARLSVRYEANDSLAVGGRLGFLVTDRNLVYALGGYSAASIKSGANLAFAWGEDPMSIAASRSRWKSGYVVGAGWQTAVAAHVALKVEYRYADFGKTQSSFDGPPPDGFYNVQAQQSGDVTVQSVRAALDYRF